MGDTAKAMSERRSIGSSVTPVDCASGRPAGMLDGMLRVWTWVACLAVLCAGQSNAHLHYCFDGQEPPVSLHLTDGIDHGHEHADHQGDHHDSEGHDDLDVDLNLADQALAKLLKLDQPWIAALGGFRALLAPPPHAVFIEWIELPPSPVPIHARPQPRGPPV